ncbi:MAG: BamA/TamA family outer membrane protein [Alphaproteobacteria bacterium]|nr:BamA/TamA family outer membrane protein [Alphaproteobacteria bacterium]
MSRPLPSPSLLHRPLPLLLPLLLVLLVACAKRNPEGELVKSIRFRGNGSPLQGTGDYNLRTAMEQEASPSFAWINPGLRVSLDRDALALDAWRLETWYAHRGFFDARFRAWDVVTVRPANRHRGPLVRIVGHVEPGEPSNVRSVQFLGMDVVGRPVVNLLERQAPLQQGGRFDLSAVDETVSLANSRLQEQGFAFAEVQSHVVALPEEQAVEVTFEATPGPPAKVGAIELSGDFGLPERLVREEITFEEGDAWRLSRLAETQQALFGLGTFSVVTITPLKDQATELEDGLVSVPVRIDLAESNARQLRVGGGVAAQSARQELHASIGFSHANVRNRLWRLDTGASAGYASVVTWAELAEQGLPALWQRGGPIAEVTAALEIPRFPLRRWRWVNEAGFELGIEPDYRFASPTASTALVWRISRKWSTRAGYRITFFDYFDSTLPDETSLLDRRGRALGLDFSDPYLLSMLQQQLVYDSRDDPIFTRRGAYSILDVAEAGGPFGGQYSFVKATADGRIWRPVPRLFGWRPRAALTARLAGGVVFPYGAEDRAQVPFAERLYVGGSSTVRGWGLDHLGPYLYPQGWDANSQEYTRVQTSAVDESIADKIMGKEDRKCFADDNCFLENGDDQLPASEIIYIGGKAALYGGFEVHGYWANNMGLAVFMDYGRAWDGAGLSSPAELLIRLKQMSVSAGAGFRYLSPVGAIRLDVARRMDGHPMFEHEPRLQVHFALSEAW